MRLLEAFTNLTDLWRPAFKRDKTHARIVRMSIGLVAALGRKTITGSACCRSLSEPVYADYKALTRENKADSKDGSGWEVSDLSESMILEAVKELPPDAPVVLAIDDTCLRKSGRQIPQARFCHDPLAPKFFDRPLCWGIRMLHCAIVLPPPPVNVEGYSRPVVITTVFKPVPAAEKPKGKEKGSAEAIAAYEARKLEATVTKAAVEAIRFHRKVLDRAGMTTREILCVVDGSYCNQHVIPHLPHHTHLIGRIREKARLRSALPKAFRTGRKFYGPDLPTPVKMLKAAWGGIRTGHFRYGGRLRLVRYLDVPGVYWDATKRRPMRMILLRPSRYNRGGSRSPKPNADPNTKTIAKRPVRRGYNRPAYLITSDLNAPAAMLVQAYLDRWQIEVLHREMKTDVGIGQTQVRNALANERTHSLQALTYATLTLAAYRAYGGQWSRMCPTFPSWRKRPPMRLSPTHLLAIFRNDLARSGYFSNRTRKSKAPFQGCVLPVREIFVA